MNTKINIFMSGEATIENTGTTFGVPLVLLEIRIDITLKKSFFLFLLCFETATLWFIPICQPSGRGVNLFLIDLSQI